MDIGEGLVLADEVFKDVNELRNDAGRDVSAARLRVAAMRYSVSDFLNVL